MYIVTDGNKLVQKTKVKCLHLDRYFKKIFITHYYGIKNSKPSLYCFEKNQRPRKCHWNELVYVGDNPAKDFIQLNKVGALTIRVKTGSYSGVSAEKEFDAQKTIENLGQLEDILFKNLK